jgi:hypothetical protein
VDARRLIRSGLVVTLAVSSACSGYRPGKLRCDTDAWEWANDPARWAQEADGDGRFDVSTEWPLVTGVSGSWAADSGQYVQHETMAADSAVVARDWAGDVELLDGGDLRFEGSYTTVDILDVTTVWDVQLARVECVQSHTFTSGRDTRFGTYTFSEGSFVESDLLLAADGHQTTRDMTYRADGSASWSQVLDYGTYVEEQEGVEDWTAGNGSGDFTGVGDGFSLVGDFVYTRDGSITYHYVLTPPIGNDKTYDYTLDYSGNGSGTVEYSDGSVCDFVQEDGAQTCDCGDGPGIC